jgi:hypothetical protein
MPFPLCHARPGAKPLEPFGKGSNAQKVGTPDAGPESPTVQGIRRMHGRPFSPRPGSSGSRPYTRPARKGKRDGTARGRPRLSSFYRIGRLDIDGSTVSFARSSEGDHFAGANFSR